MQSKNKYFWKRQLESIVFDKSYSIYLNIFTNSISIFYFPSILLKLIKIKASNEILNKSKYLLVYGKLILYKSGVLIIFIENIKFIIQKAKSSNDQDIITILYRHNLILNIGVSTEIFHLIPSL
nr:hypothetical protein Cry52Nrm1_p006 [Cryptomonas curvata]